MAKHLRKLNRPTAFDGVNGVLLFIVAVLSVFPFLYILFLSISDGRSVANGEVIFWPVGVNVESYKFIFNTPTLSILTGMRNSFLYTALGTLISLLSTFMTSFVLTRRKFKGRYLFMSLFVFTWVFEAGIIPYYIVLSQLGFVNNPLVMVIPFAINTQYLLIANSYLNALPNELEEACVVDGANDFQILFRVYLPVSKPIIATIGLFYAVYIWNQYLLPQMYLRMENLHTIQQVIKKLVISQGDTVTLFVTTMQNGHMVTPSTLSSAAIFVAMAPIVLVYPFIQKYIKKGILLGSVKG